MDVSLSKLWEAVRAGKPRVLQSMRSQRVGHDLATKQQQRYESNLNVYLPKDEHIKKMGGIYVYIYT